MAKILVLQHHPTENLGAIADALEGAALAWQYIRVFDGQPMPKDVKGLGGLIVMGGPQTVYQLERYPYLRDELTLIESALKADKPILGVCLGSQLLAATLGAEVRRGDHREIGWYPVRLAEAAKDDALMRGLPGEFVAAHWHSDALRFAARGGCAGVLGKNAGASLSLRRQGLRDSLSRRDDARNPHRTGRRVRRGPQTRGPGWRRDAGRGRATPARLGRIGDTIFGRWASPIQGT